MNTRIDLFRGALIAGMALVFAACGDSDPAGPEDPATPAVEGTWQRSTTTRERTLQLRADGSVSDVDARFDALTCSASSGTWSATGTTLTLDFGGTTEVLGYDVYPDSIVLGGGSAAETYVAVSTLPGCDGYDFRRWTGTLTADIDSVPQTFENISITTTLASGVLEIRACPVPGRSCEQRDAELILNVNTTPGPLTPGTYPVQPDGVSFFALIDPFPDDPNFPGFNTERLLPPGQFVLAAVSDTRVEGTFEFRANEISEGLSAPDGRRFVLVTNGVVELDLR